MWLKKFLKEGVTKPVNEFYVHLSQSIALTLDHTVKLGETIMFKAINLLGEIPYRSNY